ncbi:hypothetical protein [Amycolatopsis sp. NPDC059657]|uniref:hypothetical protein n=1 Tax=Amycolatopsis sp. NPDC059657 TaxID=3346899 RepID=UPI00367053A9
MSDKHDRRALVGPAAHRWTTLKFTRVVLVAVHNVTTLTRLLDVIPAFENDERVQLFFTHLPGDPFPHGLTDILGDSGAMVIPWKQAERKRFDLAISASHHGMLGKIRAPLVLLSHGIGYTKYSPQQAAGSRQQAAGSRQQAAGSRQAFGLSAEWLLHKGKPRADAFCLSHDHQLELVRETAPAALQNSFVVGDPCYDRIVASSPLRNRYRAALHVGTRRLVLVSSTWSGSSLLGSRPSFLRELLSELPRDSWLVAVAPHPNVRHGHGPDQVRRWYADCLRAGMVILPEFDGWRAGLIAADIVLGDHGSVTGYAAALGKPTLLAAFDDVPPGTPISALGDTAPRLRTSGPFLPHLVSAIEEHKPDRFASVAERVTSLPGRSLKTLRELFYRLLELDEPPAAVTVETIPALPVEPSNPDVLADLVTGWVDMDSRQVELERRPAEVVRPGTPLRQANDDEQHVNCSFDHPARSLVANAAVLIVQETDPGPLPQRWWQEFWLRHPACTVAAVGYGWTAQVWMRDGTSITLTSPGMDAAILASAVYLWQAAGLPVRSLETGFSLRLGDETHDVAVAL